MRSVNSMALWLTSAAICLVPELCEGQAAIATPSGSAAITALSQCEARDGAPRQAPQGGAGFLVAVCGSRQALISPADQYSVNTNAATGSVLIVAKRIGRTRVWLASPTANGGLHLDNVTGALAKLGGRVANSGLGNLTVDATTFEKEGSVGIKGSIGVKHLDIRRLAAQAATKAEPTSVPMTATMTDESK